MAIAGGATPSFIAEIVDGKLELSRQSLRQGVITDVDIAIHELLKGKRIFIHAYAATVERVTKTIEMTLARQVPPAPVAEREGE